MNYVVTGATSMIGVALIKCLIKNNHKVLAIVRKNSKKIARLPKSHLISIYESDLCAIETVKCNGKYDVFYHLGWAGTSKKERDDSLIQSRNIQYTLSAVKLAKKLGCSRFIGAGSQAESGIIKKEITEDTVGQPETAYGVAKSCSNFMSLKLCKEYNITHIWARIFSVYGLLDNEYTLINYCLNKFKNNEDAVFSSASQYWNFIFEDDAARMLYAMSKGDVPEGIYCVAHPESKILKEFILQIKEATTSSSKMFFKQQNNENLVTLFVNAKKTYQKIKYTPETSFQEGLMKLLQGNQTHE